MTLALMFVIRLSWFISVYFRLLDIITLRYYLCYGTNKTFVSYDTKKKKIIYLLNNITTNYNIYFNTYDKIRHFKDTLLTTIKRYIGKQFSCIYIPYAFITLLYSILKILMIVPRYMYFDVILLCYYFQ